MALNHPELTARHHRRRYDHQTRAVARFGRVIAQPHLAVSQRARRQWFVVLGPVDPTVHHARLQHCQRKDTRPVVHKLAHQQVLEGLGVVLLAQLFKVEQVTAALLGVQNRDDLPPHLVLAQPPLLQGIVGHIHGNTVGGRLALVEALPRPERVGLVGHARRGAEVSAAVLFLHRHARGDLVQFLELERPEEFIEVEVAVVALGGSGVGAQEVQLCAVRQRNGIASQLNADDFPGKGLNIRLENVSLILRRRQENLVTAGGQGINQRLPSEVESSADLPAFQDGPGALIASFVPIQLITEAPIDKSLGEQLDMLFAELIAARFFLWPAVAVIQLRV